MKRLVTVLLILCIVLSGCSGTPGVASDPLTLPQFEEKYKRSDWNEMVASPKAFFEDFHSIRTLPFDQAVPDAAELESTEESYGTEYDKNIVLFNMPFTAHITNSGKIFTCSLHYKGDPEECYSSFKALFEGLIKEYGDPASMDVGRDDTEVDESTFRKALADGDLEVPLSAHWTEKTDKGDVSLALISYWNYLSAELSLY